MPLLAVAGERAIVLSPQDFAVLAQHVQTYNADGTNRLRTAAPAAAHSIIKQEPGTGTLPAAVIGIPGGGNPGLPPIRAVPVRQVGGLVYILQ